MAQQQPTVLSVSLPEELAEAAQRKGWPPGLLERALELRIGRSTIKRWLESEWAAPEYIQRRLDWHERMTFGTLRGREATGADNDAIADLFANAPEEVGDWEIYTERGPNAFAQFRLQENVNVLVIEETGVLIACCSFTVRKTIAGGKRVSVRYGQALRVHKDYRRQGYGDQVRSIPWGVGAARPSHGQYDIMRSQNFAIVNWWKKYVPDFFEDVPQREGEVPGIPVTVLQYPARTFSGDTTGIRKARPADLSRCIGLINQTHRGLDLFRPCTRQYLEDRLDDGFRGEAPELDWPHVYGWDDYYVLEEGERLVACAGLWDRGRDMRDRWRHKETGEEKTIAVSAVLDFGFERGSENAMARLLRFLIGETHRLGRDYLTVPLDHSPQVAALLENCEPVPETRSLRWGVPGFQITRPHIDLSYW